MSVILMMLPVILSIIIKYPSIETEIKKFPIKVGLKFELTVVSHLKPPEFISTEKNWLLLFEKNKLFSSAIISDVSREKEDS